MEYKNIATAINNATKNRMSDAPVIAEDLSNITDIGVLVDDMTEDEIKAWFSEISIAVGIAENFFMTKEYKPNMLGIVKSSKELGGARQRIALKTIVPAVEDHSLNLINGQNYFDGVYHGEGLDLDARVYTKTNGYEVKYSVAVEMLKKAFTKAEDVDRLISTYLAWVKTSMNIKEKALVDDLVMRGIVDTIKDNRYIDLVALFNAEFGYEGENALTFAQISSDDVLYAQFKAMYKETRALVRDGFKKLGSKYNNGDYPTFTNEEDIKQITITKFANKMSRMTFGSDKRAFDDNITEETTIAWQNDGANKVVSLADCCKIVDGTTEDSDTYNNIVSVMFDRDALTVVNEFKKTTSQYIADGDFVTYFNKVATNLEFYPCSNMVVFTLGAPTE